MDQPPDSPLKKNDLVTFRMRRDQPKPRNQGVVISCQFIGLTQVGQIPDFEVVIEGQSGHRVTVSLVENYVRKK